LIYILNLVNVYEPATSGASATNIANFKLITVLIYANVKITAEALLLGDDP
jgi:hypothetical protein